jgi:hypothetical protein
MVYPNPSTGEFKFNMNGAENGKSDITIYNLQGQIVLHKKVNSKVFTISLTNHSDGIYFYQVKGIKTLTGKLVKH